MGNKPCIIEPSPVVLEQPKQVHVQTINGPVRVRDSQELTCKEMEMEFDKIYERSKEILGSLSKNPCHELTQRITECLENNSMQMGKCFSVMDEYRMCVKEQVSERLAQHDGKDNAYRPKIHEIEQVNEITPKKIEEAETDETEQNAPEKIGDQANNEN